MAAEKTELDEINRLLEVEKKAASLIEQAMTDADKCMDAARIEFNQKYKTLVEEQTQKITAEYNENLEKIKQNHQKEIDAYKLALEEKQLNQSDFNALLEKSLFEQS